MVHMEKSIAKSNCEQIPSLLKKGGIAFLDHPGKGAKVSGHRTNILNSDISMWLEDAGMKIMEQKPRGNGWDSITISKKI